MSYRDRLTGEQIRVSLNSGANIHSRNTRIVTASDLGFASKSEWDNASEVDKYAAVVEYFEAQCLPEYSWSDAGDE